MRYGYSELALRWLIDALKASEELQGIKGGAVDVHDTVAKKGTSFPRTIVVYMAGNAVTVIPAQLLYGSNLWLVKEVDLDSQFNPKMRQAQAAFVNTLHGRHSEAIMHGGEQIGELVGCWLDESRGEHRLTTGTDANQERQLGYFFIIDVQ